MPEAKVACESCPWPATAKRAAAATITEDVKRETADGIAQDCREDGGTCYGAVRWAMSPMAEPYRHPPAAGRGQAPETPDHRPAITAPTTAVDFVSTDPKED